MIRLAYTKDEVLEIKSKHKKNLRRSILKALIKERLRCIEIIENKSFKTRVEVIKQINKNRKNK